MSDFYVYYEERTGKIKVLSPVESDDQPQCAVTRIPSETAIRFITGEDNVDKWFITANSTPEQGYLTQNEFDLKPLDTGKVISIQRASPTQAFSSAIFVRVFTTRKKFEVAIPEQFINYEMKYDLPDNLEFHLTRRNDPTVVYEDFVVSVKELFEKGKVECDMTVEAKDFSVFTKQYFMHYQLEVKRSFGGGKSKRVGNTRFNKLVCFDLVKKEKDANNGIIVIHNINNSTLEIRVLGHESELQFDGMTQGILFLTKHRDPTVLVDMIKFDIAELMDRGKIVIKLSNTTGTDFGVSSYPYADALSLLRK